MPNWCHARSGGFVLHAGDSRGTKGQHVMSANLGKLYFSKTQRNTNCLLQKYKQVNRCLSLK